MLGRTGVAQVAGVATGTAAKTIIQLVAAAQHPIEIAELWIGFHGISATAEPIKVDLVRQTDAGTMTSLTLNKNNDSDGDSLDTSAQHTATVEPTTTDVLRAIPIHPQTGAIVMFPEDTRPKVGAGDRLGLRVTAAASVNCDATLVFNE